MKRSLLLLLIAFVIVAQGLIAEAQQTKKIAHIGFLSGRAGDEREEAFRQGLRELGYVEGQNVVIDWRFAKGNADRLPELAAELIRLKLDLIVTGEMRRLRRSKKQLKPSPLSRQDQLIPSGVDLWQACHTRAEMSQG